MRAVTPGVEAPRKTGDATTSGPQSPAVTGNGNEIKYEQAPREKKPAPAKKE